MTKLGRRRAITAGLISIALILFDPAGARAEPVSATAAAHQVGDLGLGQYRDTFAGLRIEPDGKTLTVWTVDAARGASLVRAGLAGLTPAARERVAVSVRQSKYTRDQLESARAALWKQAPKGSYLAVAVPSDGSGLIVTVADPVAAKARLGGLPLHLAAGVSSADVRFVAGSRMRPMSRVNDSAPYKGGIPLESFWSSDHICTSSFGMSRNGTTYLVTAEHCFDNGDWVYDHNDDYIGSVSFVNTLVDAAAVATSAGATLYINATQTRVYQRADLSWNGESVCQSGYTSNQRCGIVVTYDNVEWDYDDGKGPRRGVYGEIYSGVSSVCEGDSGGPVWSTGVDGVMESRGIVSGGGIDIPGQPGCSQVLAWTETPAVLYLFGGSMITG